jgi:hypothetical protein
MSTMRIFIACGLATALGGCGLYTPEKFLFNKDRLDQARFENLIVNNVQCELQKGVQYTLYYFKDNPEQLARLQWLKKWGALVQLKITADELSGLSPNVSFMEPLPSMQSFALGLAAAGTAHATRVETISFAVSFQDLYKLRPDPCDREDGIFIQSDLKIWQFIFDKAVIATIPGSVEPYRTRGPPYTVLSDEITFVASIGGSITPTWKLTRVSADTSGTLAAATRTKTNDVIITLGYVTHQATAVSPVVLSTDAQTIHNALVVGSAVGTANKSQN